MYGPPQSCKRKTENDGLVCANVFGLWWSFGCGRAAIRPRFDHPM
jgi:hypothetical protein